MLEVSVVAPVVVMLFPITYGTLTVTLLFCSASDTFVPATSDLTVVPDSSCVPEAAFVKAFCLPDRADCVAYTELMSTPATCRAVAFTVAKFAVLEKVLAPDIVCAVASVAYVEPMSTPATCIAEAFTAAKFAVLEKVLAPEIVWAVASVA